MLSGVKLPANEFCDAILWSDDDEDDDAGPNNGG